jgi:hypothetical protein
MKTYGAVKVLAPPFTRCEWPASHPGHFTPEEIFLGPCWIGGWVGPRVDLGAVEKRYFFIFLAFSPVSIADVRPLDLNRFSLPLVDTF